MSARDACPEIVVTSCPVHGQTTAPDAVSALLYQSCVRECQQSIAADDHDHTDFHDAAGVSCWVCCSLMDTPTPPVDARALLERIAIAAAAAGAALDDEHERNVRDQVDVLDRTTAALVALVGSW